MGDDDATSLSRRDLVEAIHTLAELADGYLRATEREEGTFVPEHELAPTTREERCRKRWEGDQRFLVRIVADLRTKSASNEADRQKRAGAGLFSALVQIYRRVTRGVPGGSIEAGKLSVVHRSITDEQQRIQLRAAFYEYQRMSGRVGVPEAVDASGRTDGLGGELMKALSDSELESSLFTPDEITEKGGPAETAAWVVEEYTDTSARTTYHRKKSGVRLELDPDELDRSVLVPAGFFGVRHRHTGCVELLTEAAGLLLHATAGGDADQEG